MGRVAALVLAAGSSSRMGRPKQLLEVDGAPMLQHAVDAAAAGGIDEVLVVLGHEAPAVEAALRLPQIARIVRNPDHAGGLSTSLRAGLRALGVETEAAVVVLGDQPELEASSIRALVEAYLETGARIVQASYRGAADHPVLLAREVWPEVLVVTGDRGARDVLAAHPEWVREVELDRDPPRDVDTPGDYEALRG